MKHTRHIRNLIPKDISIYMYQLKLLKKRLERFYALFFLQSFTIIIENVIMDFH